MIKILNCIRGNDDASKHEEAERYIKTPASSLAGSSDNVSLKKERSLAKFLPLCLRAKNSTSSTSRIMNVNNVHPGNGTATGPTDDHNIVRSVIEIHNPVFDSTESLASSI